MIRPFLGYSDYCKNIFSRRLNKTLIFIVVISKNADAQLTPSDLQAWEEKHGKIPDDVILLVFTDWGRRWPNKKTYLGSDTKNTSLLHFPGMLLKKLSEIICHAILTQERMI